MDKNSKIYIAGHTGLAGSAILRNLQSNGYGNLLVRSHAELDLADQAAVKAFFAAERPEYVFMAAAKVGGIMANIASPYDYMYQNLAMELNVISSAFETGAKKLIFLGSSCSYPKDCPQPMKEEHLLTSPFEPSNKPYSLAKISGITLCQSLHAQHGANFISVVPTNLYGPNDNFDAVASHVIPGMIVKFEAARDSGAESVTLWGSGQPRREFLHADDLASACLYLMETYDQPEIVNIGTGVDISIKELAELIKSTVGFTGRIDWDTSKPDGVARKILDVSKLTGLGWKSSIPLSQGIIAAYQWHANNLNK